ncbi:hypothetical protein OH687_21990 [Burkholderia anthina]|nr:hypothetical protein OH687_21990 [Burkholderia anthina]
MTMMPRVRLSAQAHGARHPRAIDRRTEAWLTQVNRVIRSGNTFGFSARTP